MSFKREIYNIMLVKVLLELDGMKILKKRQQRMAKADFQPL
jgi:hypothetical protein